MILKAKGRLFLGRDKANGIYAYDGINFLKIYSLYLIHKLFKHRKKIIVFIAGDWLQWNNIIIWFKRNKKNVAHHFPIGEVCDRSILNNNYY